MSIQTQLDAMDYAELVDKLDEEFATAVMNSREHKFGEESTPEGEWTDEEWEQILEERPDLHIESDRTFTIMSQDDSIMATLNEVETQTVQRWVEVEALREHYALFEDFLYDCMTELMGFQCSELQIDIARFLQSDVKNGMIQAQRSQAKSTIVAMFAVWQLIHDCKHRVLIISAGSDVAAEIANWVIQIIMNWDILECMRPDRQHGDRASSKSFDVNWQLKGPEKSPSVACIGVTANMQGRRADLLIPDDIESSKNGTTETQRAALEHLSKDFTSICQTGRIIYLGTPQTVDSIYNNLPARGYEIRIWTGRFPTKEEHETYEGRLAPYLQNMMDNDPTLQIGGGVDGSRGKPTDPLLLGEELLAKKELDQGPAYFNLQHMLNTNLSDEQRHPLKAKNLIVMNVPFDRAPGQITWMPSPTNMISNSGYTCKPEFYRPFSVSTELFEYEGKHMYIDTAGGGQNGDETAATVTYFLHGYIFWAETKSWVGGYGDAINQEISEMAFRHGVNAIDVEKNFGNGMFAANLRPTLLNYYLQMGASGCPAVEDVWESGQKEKRIIDILEPVMARHKLIMSEAVLDYDVASTKKYPIDVQQTYTVIHQMSKITLDKGALIHDDRLDSLAGSVRHWVEHMAVDDVKRMEDKKTDENVAFFEEWGADISPWGNGNTLGLVSDRFTRKHNRR